MASLLHPVGVETVRQTGQQQFFRAQIADGTLYKSVEENGKKYSKYDTGCRREFIGPQWLNYLHEQGIYFVFRLRENMRLGEIEMGSKKKHHLRSYAGEIERYGIYRLPVQVGENTYWLYQRQMNI